MINRRTFTALLGCAALSTVVPVIAGCPSAESVFASILAWVSNAGPKAFNAIMTLLKAAGITLSGAANTLVGQIFAGFTALDNAVTEYQSTTPPPAGALAEVDTAVTDLLNSFQGFLNNIPTVGPIISIALAILQVIISTIMGFEANLPASVVLTKTHKRLQVPFRHAGAVLTITPVKRTNRQFAQAVNAPIEAGVTAGTITALVAKESKLRVPLFG